MGNVDYSLDAVRSEHMPQVHGNAAVELARTVRYFVSRYPRRSAAVFVASLALVGLELLGGAALMPVLALAVEEGTENRLLAIVRATFETVGLTLDLETAFLVFVVVLAAKAIMEMVFGIFVHFSKVAVEKSFRTRIIRGLKQVSWGYFTAKPNGLLVNLMTQEVARAAGLFGLIMQVAVSGLQATAYLVLGLAASTDLLVAAVVLVVAGVLVSRPMFRMARRAGAGEVEQMRHIAADLLQGIQAYKVFKAMAREHLLLETLRGANDHYVDANKLKIVAHHLLTASQQIVLAIGVVLAVFLGRDLFGVGMAEIGFIALILLRTNGHLATLLKKFQAITNTYYALGRYDEFVEEIETHSEAAPGRRDPNYPSEIRFEDVSFRYGERPILQGVGLTIPPTGLTTIVGPSGSGKTTIIDLLCGFFSPEGGRILIDGDPIQELNIRKWRSMIGYVTQDPNLLHQSIASNVAAFDRTLSVAEVAEALRGAGALQFVSGLDRGADSSAGERGGQLSGGERQRIAIARALARKPKLLILDEPTSAVDAAAERELVETIVRLKGETPIIAISHQPILAEAADVSTGSTPDTSSGSARRDPAWHRESAVGPRPGTAFRTWLTSISGSGPRPPGRAGAGCGAGSCRHRGAQLPRGCPS